MLLFLPKLSNRVAYNRIMCIHQMEWVRHQIRFPIKKISSKFLDIEVQTIDNVQGVVRNNFVKNFLLPLSFSLYRWYIW